MKIKLKPWGEVVALTKKRGNFVTECDDGTVVAFGLTADVLPWGQYTEAVGVNTDGNYFVLNKSGNNCRRVHPYMIDSTPPTSDDLLRYGKVIADDAYGSIATNFGKRQAVRIRLIAYDGKLWYHKMVDGNVVDFRRVGTADA